MHINPFSTNVRLLYPLKNLRFSDVFREYRSGTLVENGLRKRDFSYFHLPVSTTANVDISNFSCSCVEAIYNQLKVYSVVYLTIWLALSWPYTAKELSFPLKVH